MTLLTFSSSAWAESLYAISTENNALARDIQKTISLSDRRSIQDVSTEIKDFLVANGYYTASLRIKGSTVHISKPIKWNFFFEGNSFYSRHFLKKSLKNSTFSNTVETLIPELEQSLIKTYKLSGFNFVQVESKLTHLKENFTSRLVFTINEKSAVRIKKMFISGDPGKFKKKELLSKIKRYSSSQTAKGIYYENAILSGVASLKNDLNNLGYFNAYVGIESLKFNRQKTKVSIGIKIYVNSPTLISSISFIGNHKVSNFWLNELLNLKQGNGLNLYDLETGLDLIEDYYLQRGFLKVKVEKDKILNYSKDLKSAQIKITIEEDEQILVSNIKIKGNLKTKASIILREITFKPGEILTADKMKSSTGNLTKLGFFTNIRLNILFKQKNNHGTPVEIILSERKSGTFTSGFGLSSELDFTAKIFAGFDYKNINGTGRAFSSRAELKRNLSKKINYLENRVFGSYVEPYLLESDVKGRISLSRNDEIWDIDPDSKLVTIIQSNRLDLILETALTDNTTLFFTPFSLDLRREKFLTDNTIFANDPSQQPQEIQEVIGSLSATIQVDHRNHPFLPTKGFFYRIQTEYASPFFGSNTESSLGKFDLEFLKIQTSHTFYKPLSKNLIWAQSFRGGYLHNFPDKDINNSFAPFPKSRAFFLGGSTTLRGFDPSKPNERIPNDTYLEDNGGILAGNTIGGGVLNIPKSSYYYLSKTELRFPLSKDSSWWGSVFYDGGSVQISSLQDHYDPWRHSIGIGLRFNTPVGPLLNAEIAYKLDRDTQSDESAIRFHLSVSSF